MRRLLLALALLVAAAPAARAGDGAEPAPQLTVMTYNVSWMRAGDAAIVGAIADAGADVVFLQETTAAWEKVLRRRLDGVYPHMLFHHYRRRPGGLAVLSRFPIEDVAYLPAPSGWFPAALMTLATPIGRIQALNVHLRPAIDGGSWIKGWFTTRKVRRLEMASYEKALSADRPTLVAGDFNEGNDGQAFALLARRGYSDALARFQPTATTWRLSPARHALHLTLDHIVTDAHLQAVEAHVVQAGHSDHLPVVATLRAAAR